MTKQAFAQKTGLPPWRVGKWIKDAMPDNFEDFEKFANGLGVSWQELLIGEEGTGGIAAPPAPPSPPPKPPRRPPPATAPEQKRARGGRRPA